MNDIVGAVAVGTMYYEPQRAITSVNDFDWLVGMIAMKVGKPTFLIIVVFGKINTSNKAMFSNGCRASIAKSDSTMMGQ